MNLYIATRYGNHIDDDPKGKDTIFFVKARSFDEAYELTNYELYNYSNDNISNKVQEITLISQIDSDNAPGITLFSPIIAFANSMNIIGIETVNYD